MEQLSNILYEYATSPSEPIASVGEYLANPISSSVLEKIFLNLDTFAAEYSNKGKSYWRAKLYSRSCSEMTHFLAPLPGLID